MDIFYLFMLFPSFQYWSCSIRALLEYDEEQFKSISFLFDVCVSIASVFESLISFQSKQFFAVVHIKLDSSFPRLDNTKPYHTIQYYQGPAGVHTAVNLPWEERPASSKADYRLSIQPTMDNWRNGFAGQVRQWWLWWLWRWRRGCFR